MLQKTLPRLRHGSAPVACVDEVVEAGAEHPGVRAQDVEEADRTAEPTTARGIVRRGCLRLLAERRGRLEADEGEDREDHPLEDAAPVAGGVRAD